MSNNAMWLLQFQPRPQANARLFCFPYAGSGAGLYYPWSKEVPEQIELNAIQLPGRENRHHDEPMTRLPLLIKLLAEVLSPHMDRPCVFFGHSMGALIAFELARHLGTDTGNNLVHLFVSGRRAPQLPSLHKPLHNLSDAELVIYLQNRYHGIPQAILNEPELLQIFLPVLRADLTLLETAFYTPAKPLSCPITALGGEQDDHVTREELLAWQEQTVSTFTLRMFPGDHFYLRHTRSQIIAMITRAVQTCENSL